MVKVWDFKHFYFSKIHIQLSLQAIIDTESPLTFREFEVNFKVEVIYMSHIFLRANQ